MRPPELSCSDVVRAHALLQRLLGEHRAPEQLRLWAERMLANAEPESHRYAFWRLTLALIIAEMSKPAARRASQTAPAA